MICKPIKRNSLYDEFREFRGQSTEAPKKDVPKKKTNGYSPYDSFLRKYASLSDYIDGFGTRDLVYYFREISEENGFKYVISNIKKDMAIMKRLRDNYTNREICGMIEFLYESDQDYLQKDRLSPNVLASQWVNTIYADMKLWVEDAYVPHSVKKVSKRSKSQHEWDNSVMNNDTKIGVRL